jgi:hypothetical protein
MNPVRGANAAQNRLDFKVHRQSAIVQREIREAPW